MYARVFEQKPLLSEAFLDWVDGRAARFLARLEDECKTAKNAAADAIQADTEGAGIGAKIRDFSKMECGRQRAAVQFQIHRDMLAAARRGEYGLDFDWRRYAHAGGDIMRAPIQDLDDEEEQAQRGEGDVREMRRAMFHHNRLVWAGDDVRIWCGVKQLHRRDPDADLIYQHMGGAYFIGCLDFKAVMKVVWAPLGASLAQAQVLALLPISKKASNVFELPVDILRQISIFLSPLHDFFAPSTYADATRCAQRRVIEKYGDRLLKSHLEEVVCLGIDEIESDGGGDILVFFYLDKDDTGRGGGSTEPYGPKNLLTLSRHVGQNSLEVEEICLPVQWGSDVDEKVLARLNLTSEFLNVSDSDETLLAITTHLSRYLQARGFHVVSGPEIDNDGDLVFRYKYA